MHFFSSSLSFLGPRGKQEYPLNPKAMSLGELYGENDLSTSEWTDGVLSSLMRSACTGADTQEHTCSTSEHIQGTDDSSSAHSQFRIPPQLNHIISSYFISFTHVQMFKMLIKCLKKYE